jgi:dipeptidyl aminopeptidase/acylaminoacyl peptidase
LTNNWLLIPFYWFWFLGVLCNGPGALADKRVSDPEQRRVTVEDAIRMTRWADRGYFLGGRPNGPVGLFSPDQTKFAVVIKKGNIAVNTVEFSLLLFETKDAFNSPTPRRLITMSSSSNRDAIANLKWLNNGTLVFLGENSGERAQVYTIDIATGRRTKLTNHATSIVSYDIGSDGKKIVFEAVVRRVWNAQEAKKSGVLITTQDASELCSEQNVESDIRELFLQKGAVPAQKISSENFFTELLPLSLSPTGNYALVGVNVGTIPVAWAEYEDELLHTHIVKKRKQGTWSALEQYMVLDTSSGTLAPLLDAPMSWSNAEFAWADDGNSVVVSGVYLPLNVSDPKEREARKKRAFVAEIGIPGGRIAKITDKPLRIVTVNHRIGRLLLQSGAKGKELPLEAYEKIGPAWYPGPSTDQDVQRSYPFEVVLDEDMNTPPRIIVAEPRSHRRALLLDLNPQFAKLRFGKVERVTWRATDGHEVVGGLYLPPDYTPGRRYPLVIQTHGFRSDRFWIDGPWSGAFAAQPLAARGFVVIQVGSATDPDEDSKFVETPEEASRQMAVYEGVVDYLDANGLGDRNRVGIIGFSRTVLYVEYALTHSKYEFKAVSLADGFDGGYLNYLLWPTAAYELVNGGQPVGSSLQLWLKNSPGFSLDKVTAAVRLEYYGHGYFLGGWQWFSGLTLLEKPVDFVWLPDGYHLLVKPWERLVSQQGTVDWFDFWLRGVEDPDAKKRGQYDRWRELRTLLLSKN